MIFRGFLDFNQISDFTKAAVTDSAHQQEMFGFAKRAELFAVINNLLCGFRADIRKFFEHFRRRRVDIYCRFGRCLRYFWCKNLFCIILPARN